MIVEPPLLKVGLGTNLWALLTLFIFLSELGEIEVNSPIISFSFLRVQKKFQIPSDVKGKNIELTTRRSKITLLWFFLL
jgi:hypothetical protein